MSHAHSSQASPSSTNFQSIFVASLKVYKKKTKNDLLVEVFLLLYLDYISHVHMDVEQTSTSPRTSWLGWLYPCVRMPRPGALDLVSVVILANLLNLRTVQFVVV